MEKENRIEGILTHFERQYPTLFLMPPFSLRFGQQPIVKLGLCNSLIYADKLVIIRK